MRLLQIATAEQHGMDEQRKELPQRDSLAPSVGQRADLVVRRRRARGNAPEQFEHGEVHLAMPAVSRRIDQPRASGAVGKDVAAPQITVQTSRRLDGRVDDYVGDLALEPD